MIKNKILLSILILFVSTIRAHTNDLKGLYTELKKNHETIEKGKNILREILFPPVQSPFLKNWIGIFKYKQKEDISIKDLCMQKPEEKKTYTPEDVRLAVWGLYGLAARSGKGVGVEMTFKIIDPSFKLFNFLSTANGAYRRASSHFRIHRSEKFRHQSAQVDWGVDLQKELPADKQHVLFNKLQENPFSEDNITFLKPEPHGINLEDFSINGIKNTCAHSCSFIASQLRKNNQAQWLLNVGSDDDPIYRKERIPAHELKCFANLISQLENNSEMKEQHLKSAKNFGIQAMDKILLDYETTYKQNLNKSSSSNGASSVTAESSNKQDMEGSWIKLENDNSLNESYVQDPNLFEDARTENMLKLIEEFRSLPNMQLGHNEIRTGREVIFTQGELKDLLLQQQEKREVRNLQYTRELIRIKKSLLTSRDID